MISKFHNVYGYSVGGLTVICPNVATHPLPLYTDKAFYSFHPQRFFLFMSPVWDFSFWCLNFLFQDALVACWSNCEKNDRRTQLCNFHGLCLTWTQLQCEVVSLIHLSFYPISAAELQFEFLVEMTQGEERIPCFAREESYTDEDMAIRRSISPSATSGRSMSNSKESSSVPQAASSGHYGSSTSEKDENSCDVRSVVSVASFRKKFGKSQSVKDTRAEFDSVIEKMAQEQLQCRGTSTVVSASGFVKQCGNSKIEDDILAFLDGMDEQQRAFYTEDEEGKRKNKKDLDELKKGSFKQGVSDPTQDLGIQADPSLHDAQLLSESKDGRIRKLTPNVSKESSKIIPGKPDKDKNTDIVSTTSNQDQIDPDEVSSAPAKVGNKEVLLMKPSNQEEEDRASPRICSAAIREGKKTLKDMNTLEEKERTLEERFKILEGRSKSSVVGLKPCGSKNRGLSASCGPLAEQLMKIDLSVRGGTLKISDRPLSESGIKCGFKMWCFCEV